MPFIITNLIANYTKSLARSCMLSVSRTPLPGTSLGFLRDPGSIFCAIKRRVFGSALRAVVAAFAAALDRRIIEAGDKPVVSFLVRKTRWIP